MDGELRMLITRRAPQRLGIDQLAEAVEEGGIGGRDRSPRQLQPEGSEFLCGMRQQIDADPDRPDLGSRLENPARNLRRMQRKPKRQAANAGPDDDDVVHVSSAARLWRLSG